MLPRVLSLVFVLFLDLCTTCVALSHMKVKFSQYVTADLKKKLYLPYTILTEMSRCSYLKTSSSHTITSKSLLFQMATCKLLEEVTHQI